MIELNSLGYNANGGGVYDQAFDIQQELKGWVVVFDGCVWIGGHGKFLFKSKKQALDMFRNHNMWSLAIDLYKAKGGQDDFPNLQEAKDLIKDWKAKSGFIVMPAAITIKLTM